MVIEWLLWFVARRTVARATITISRMVVWVMLLWWFVLWVIVLLFVLVVILIVVIFWMMIFRRWRYVWILRRYVYGMYRYYRRRVRVGYCYVWLWYIVWLYWRWMFVCVWWFVWVFWGIVWGVWFIVVVFIIRAVARDVVVGFVSLSRDVVFIERVCLSKCVCGCDVVIWRWYVLRIVVVVGVWMLWFDLTLYSRFVRARFYFRRGECFVCVVWFEFFVIV